MMSVVTQPISRTDYFRRDAKSVERLEYFRGEVFAMSGGTPQHALIAANFIREAGNKLSDSNCRVFSSDLRILVPATGLYTYPDATIVCGDLEIDPEDPSGNTVTNLKVLVEVLSDTTEAYDRGAKRRHYASIESLTELWLVHQKMVHVERYERRQAGTWLLSDITDLMHAISLTELDASIAMSELYRGARFEPPELRDQV